MDVNNKAQNLLDYSYPHLNHIIICGLTINKKYPAN